MTDPKTLQEIAEQACIFDRAHFDDDTAPTVGIVKKPPPPPPPAASIAYTITLWREDDDAPFATFSVVACDDMHASQLANDLAKLNGAHSFAFIAEDFPACARNIATLVAATEQPKAEPRRSYPLAPTPIALRDNDERSYWDEMTRVLARKQDTTSQSVACAADEMVEERRARMPLARQVRDELREPGDGEIGYEAFLLHGEVRVTHDGRTDGFDVENDERFKGKPATEVTDELLLEAASYANGDRPRFNDERDLVCAKEAMTRLPGEWYRTCRAYVEGALRKARKP